MLKIIFNLPNYRTQSGELRFVANDGALVMAGSCRTIQNSGISGGIRLVEIQP